MVGLGAAPRVLFHRRGLGQSSSQSPSVISSAFWGTVDCSQGFDYYTAPQCWGMSLAQWQAMNALAVAGGPMPSPTPPSITPQQAAILATNPPVPVADQITQDQLTAAATQTQANNLAYFQTLAANFPTAALNQGPCLLGTDAVSQWICGNWTTLIIAAGALLLIAMVKH